MAQMMNVAVVHEFGKPLKIEEVPIPTPRRGEVLIKLVANAFAIRTSMRPRVTGPRSRCYPLSLGTKVPASWQHSVRASSD